MKSHSDDQTKVLRVKIRFVLTQSDDGYPPATTEDLWAIDLGDKHYRIDNIPFFVMGVSCYDIVKAEEGEGGILFFDHLVAEEGHSTVRVILLENNKLRVSVENRSKELRNALKLRGCSTEQSHIPGLISVDVPPEVDFQSIRVLLQHGEKDGLWDYEEATIAHVES